MSKGKWRINQGEVRRLATGLKRAGVEIAKIEIDKDGKIVVVVGKAHEKGAFTDNGGFDMVEDWIRKNAH